MKLEKGAEVRVVSKVRGLKVPVAWRRGTWIVHSMFDIDGDYYVTLVAKSGTRITIPRRNAEVVKGAPSCSGN